MPGGGAWAGLQVALLHVGRLVQHVTVVVVEPLAAGSLADHQAGPPAAAARLGALVGGGRRGGGVSDYSDVTGRRFPKYSSSFCMFQRKLASLFRSHMGGFASFALFVTPVDQK